MKKILTIFTLLWVVSSFSQVVDPVKWTSHTEKISDTEYDLVFKAKIQKGWHLYSQYNPDNASLPIEIESDQAGDLFTFEGKAKESPTHTAYTKAFKKDEIFFSDHAMLKQRIKLKKPGIDKVVVSIYGQACEEACVQIEKTITFDLANATTDITPMPVATPVDTHDDKDDKETEIAETETTSDEKENNNESLWLMFFLAMGGGFLAILTPCVFPLIPMTVSFFMKKKGDKAQGIKNGLVFGVSIVAIYVFLGTFVSFFLGADAMNEFSTGALFNLLFFVILVFFALSFLGAFEIMLPSSWGTKIDAQVDKKGGYIGIFFMALALAVVSFSCTMPVVGAALAASASGGWIGPIISMFGFSLALALPFVLFAMFPSWLNALPQSGGWMTTVKVFLGFVELAFAFKFLSNADLVYNLHWFERETFIAIWITVFGALAFYLFGKLKLPHDSDDTRISVGRLMLGLFIMAFTVYLIPGMFGAPLKLISGFPPPLKYAESPYGVGYTKLKTRKTKLPEGAHLGPHDIISFEDYDLGMAYAKKKKKPVLVDFTGKACVNCRKMEDYVWGESKVLNILNKDVVLISLYVDFKEKLPKDKQYVSEHTGKKIRTIGNKWSEMQFVKYKSNTQPYYVMLDENGDKLIESAYTYDSSVDKFYKWLKEGVSAGH